MRRRQPRPPSPLRQSLVFWLTVAVAAAGAGAVSFLIGRDWLGRRLGSLDIRPGAPRIVARADPALEDDAKKPAGPPPDKAIINVEEREPTAAEVRELKEHGRSEESQEQSEEDQPDAEPPEGSGIDESTDERGKQSAPEDEGQPEAEADSSRGKYAVIAGAYRDSANARRAVARLAAKGYKPLIETVTVHGEEVQRVKVAAFSARARAEDLRDELIREGLRAYITTEH